MRLSNKKYPSLQFLKKPLPLLAGQIPIKVDRRFYDMVQEHAAYYNEEFSYIARGALESANITSISESVRRAFDDEKSISEKLWLLRNEVPTGTGVLLLPNGMSYFYDIENDHEDQRVTTSVFAFYGDELLSYLWLRYDHSSIANGNQMGFDTRYCFDKAQGAPGWNLSFSAQVVVTFLLFKEFATLETHYTDGVSTKRAVLNGEKSLNELELPVTFIDSTWFTRIVRTEGFKVSGHFRLQPYGPGLSEKKLILIEEYRKEGYVRKAGIETKAGKAG